jgi:hypothetical protein
LSSPVHAAEPATQYACDSKKNPEKNLLYDWLQRFNPHGMNDGVWQLSNCDEQALEVQVSF